MLKRTVVGPNPNSGSSSLRRTEMVENGPICLTIEIRHVAVSKKISTDTKAI